MYKYEVGSKVYHAGCPATVQEHTGINKHGVPEYYVVYDDPKLGFYYCTERQLTDDSMFVNWCNSPNLKKCECGVDSLGGGIHSDWCPKYLGDYSA